MTATLLRVGVPENLLALEPTGGHGKVWHRTLSCLRETSALAPIDPASGKGRYPWSRVPDVVLADGHADLPPKRRPLVVQVHEAGWFDPKLRELLNPRFYEEISRRTAVAIGEADHIITPSHASRRDVISGFDVEPTTVHAVPHGVDPVFNPGARGGRRLVAQRRGGQEVPYVLFAAMIHPRKNLAALREAMSQLVAEGLPHVLVVVGGPATDRPDSSNLERAAAAELPGADGRVVRFNRPSDNELAGLMAEADAFCLPSLYEGFGLTVLEAMACATPVVVSDRGALPEVVGNAGLIVSPTGEQVAGALRRILLEPDLASRLGSAAGRRAEIFTWERTAEGWLSVLRAAVEGPSGTCGMDTT